MNKINRNHYSIGLYVHVPFCQSTCDFCAFYQKVPESGEILTYLNLLEQEWNLRNIEEPVQTLFFGGGTPGLLASKDWERIGDFIKKKVGSTFTEWTVEMAPSLVTKTKIKILKEIGVTRISLGVQSFSDCLLKKLGRQHTRKQIFSAITIIQNGSFENWNIDLMFALPEQKWVDLKRDLTEAIALKPTHLSTYCLTIEEDTPLYWKFTRGEIKIDPEKEMKLYKKTWDLLSSSGYNQYEISNFKTTGFSCQHNLNTWKMNDWLGLGPSAASQYKMRRWNNKASLKSWIEHISSGRFPEENTQVICLKTLLEDTFIFGLRMNQGVDLANLESKFGKTALSRFEPILKKWELAGYLNRQSNHVYLNTSGRLLADRIGASFLIDP